jgi:hypothetical protein
MKHKPKSSSSSPTKGKTHGKGKEKGSSSTNGSTETIDLKDCPLRLPEFAEIDPSKVVPRFSAGLILVLLRLFL